MKKLHEILKERNFFEGGKPTNEDYLRDQGSNSSAMVRGIRIVTRIFEEVSTMVKTDRRAP